MFVWLHNIRSAHNVGTILRTADALGNVTVVLSGYTPRLLDKYGLSNKKLLKVSLGAEESVPVLEFDEKEDFLNYLASKNKSLNTQDLDSLQDHDFYRLSSLTGCEFVSLELTPNSIPYKEFKTKNLQNTVLILGNEVSGVEDELLIISSKILEIPMSGNKESLNVAISFAVVAFYLRDIT